MVSSLFRKWRCFVLLYALPVGLALGAKGQGRVSTVEKSVDNMPSAATDQRIVTLDLSKGNEKGLAKGLRHAQPHIVLDTLHDKEVGRASIPSDSISLSEVAVRGFSPLKYMAGSYVQTLDSLSRQQFASRRLDELLGQFTSLAFRSYGNGQLSTIAFRGLSPSHTAVIWNGININLPTVGQTDFSSLNTISFERLSVQYGAGASNLGTDAIGGSIILESTPAYSKGLSLEGGASLASFQNRTVQLTARYRTRLSPDWQISGKTGYTSAGYPNRYPAPTFKGRRLEHSTTYQKGIVQDIFLENKTGKIVSAHLWVSEHDITLRPNQPSARELTGMKSIRTTIKYVDEKWQISTSFLRDIIDYGTGDYSQMDRSRTDRLGVKAQREWTRRFDKSGLSLLAGAEYSLFKAKVNGYELPFIIENRGDAFLLTRWQQDNGFTATVNLRQALAEGYKVPLTPSLGIDYPLLKKDAYLLSVSTTLAKSYRVPTLNERYWKDLGNPDIRPESGLNKEAGITQNVNFQKKITLKTRYNIFHNRVDDWVYWNPSRNYRAENLQQVLARGLEFHHHLTYARNDWSAGIQSLVSYTRSTQEKAYDTYSEEVLGRQIRFVPVWVSNLNAFIRFKKSTLSLQQHYESLRYINDIQHLPAYYLIDLLVSQTVRVGKTSAYLQVRAANLTDQLYLNVKSNAMPGRSFHFSLMFNYHLSSSK